VKKSIKDANILILGVAYKKDIDDVRESPALIIIERLRQEGANITYHDPYISEIQPHGGCEIHLKSVDLTPQALAASDCVLILTDHSKVDYDQVVEQAQLIVDTRNATKNVLAHREKIFKI